MLASISMRQRRFLSRAVLAILLLFGAKRIPEIAGSFGKGIKEFKKNMNDVQRDIAEPPAVSMLDVLNRSGQIVMGVGKVHDLFAGRGLTRAFPAATATAALEETTKLIAKMPRGLLYASLDLTAERSRA